ncbi:MAG: YdcF family protein [Actinobacteria bacterium]|nr:YdcF family protein [Actinomycetota bacterium]
MIRWGLRLGLGVIVCVLAYLAVTFVQVHQASSNDDRSPSDAIVVLGAAQYDGRPSPALRGRLDHANELYRSGVAPRIVLTGSNQPGDRFTEAFAGFTYLREQGVSESDLVIVDDGDSTWESLAAAERILAQRGWERVTLVSDGYHNARLEAMSGDLGRDGFVSPSTTGGSLGEMARETGLVAVGRVIGFDRLLRYRP